MNRTTRIAMPLLAAALLTGCGGGGGGGNPPTPDPQPNPPTEAALTASKPGELLEYVKGKLRERQQLRIATPDLVFVTGGTVTATTGAAATDAANRSSTVVQEAGVDEDDLIKTDGSIIFTLAVNAELKRGEPAARLQAWRRAADGSIGSAGSLATLQEPEGVVRPTGMLMAANAQRVAVLGESALFYTLNLCAPGADCPTVGILPPVGRTQPLTHAEFVNTGNPAAPASIERWSIDGRLIGSRLIGNQLYLVTQNSPQVVFEALPLDATPAERDAALARLTTADVLPKIRVNGGAAQPLVTDTDCFIQPKNAAQGIEITTVVVVDLSASAPRRTARCFAGGSEAIYMSTTSLYLATTRWNYTPAAAALIRLPANMTTDLHKFALAAGTLEYRGSGEVPGHLGWDVQRKSYRLSEWNGDLRVLTYTGELGWGLITDGSVSNLPPPSPAQLTVLRENAGNKTLEVLSRLPNAQRPAAIGKPNEQVYAVRFLGDRGYVVTFRRTDPLYVLDLSNPADPRAVGELEISGFSDYLFPVSDGLLLGVGREADSRGVVSGVKVALFDVANATQPRQLAALQFGGPPSQTGLDMSRHGIDLFTRGSTTRVALPMLLRESWNAPASERGLQRMEVDASARTLRAKPMIASPKLTGAAGDLAFDRSVQIDNKVYYFSGGNLTAWDW